MGFAGELEFNSSTLLSGTTGGHQSNPTPLGWGRLGNTSRSLDHPMVCGGYSINHADTSPQKLTLYLILFTTFPYFRRYQILNEDEPRYSLIPRDMRSAGGARF